MSDIREARNALEKRISEGDGETSLSESRATFDNKCLVGPVSVLADKVARYCPRFRWDLRITILLCIYIEEAKFESMRGATGMFSPREALRP
jgi:hypothetical protein